MISSSARVLDLDLIPAFQQFANSFPGQTRLVSAGQVVAFATDLGKGSVQVETCRLYLEARQIMEKRPARRRKKLSQPAAPSPAVLAILARFRVIFQTNRQHYQSVEQTIGLGGSQLQALAIIAAQPKVGISALAKAMLVRQPTASNLVEQLAQLGLVSRKKSGSDLRATELTITAKARKILARAPGPVIGILAEAIGSLPPGAIDGLRKSLDAVLHAMKSRDDGARFRPLADM